MAGLQRSAVSFRRQGSSGLIWDDKLLKAELDLQQQQQQQLNQDPQTKPIQQDQDQEHLKLVKDEIKPSRTVGSVHTIERSRSNGGGRAFRTGKVSPAIEPPSPKVSACGFCGAFGKRKETRGAPKSGKRRA